MSTPVNLRAIAGRLPPHDLEAEAAVISSLIIAPERWDEVRPILEPTDFYSDANRHIYAAIAALQTDGIPVDIITVRSRLVQDERLQQVGGVAYLAQVVDATPAVHNVAVHARTVEEKARHRRVIAEAQRITAEGYAADPGPNYASESAKALADAAGLDKRRSGVLHAAWQPMPVNWLYDEPAPQRYLMCHPDRAGLPVPPGEGDGMIPLGRAGMLSSAGGVGKTIALIELGISVITGRPWLGHFHPSWESRKGRVLLLLAEEDAGECQRRIKRISDSLNLSDDERAKVAQRMIILGLAGKPVAFLSGGGFNPVNETSELASLKKLLKSSAGEHGWSLIVLDPLARWSGIDVESDNQAATRFVQTVESLTTCHGNPTVIVCHHSSKTARRDGKADSRGVTGLTDGFRWAATLSNKRTTVEFQQEKSNLSRPMPVPLELVRKQYGILRAKDELERARELDVAVGRAEERAEKADAVNERAIERMQQHILTVVRGCMIKGVKLTTKRQLRDLCQGKTSCKIAALTRLLANASIIEVNGELQLPEGS